MTDDEQPLPMIGGYAESLIYPDEIAFFTDEERDAWRAELRDRQERRRPAGFTAWKADPEPEIARLRVVGDGLAR